MDGGFSAKLVLIYSNEPGQIGESQPRQNVLHAVATLKQVEVVDSKFRPKCNPVASTAEMDSAVGRLWLITRRIRKHPFGPFPLSATPLGTRRGKLEEI
jgi:hypothetical protein